MDGLGLRDRGFLCLVTRMAAIIMTIIIRMSTKNNVEDRKFVKPFTAFVVGVVTKVVSMGAAGVSVGVTCGHHWFIEVASKVDLYDCKFCSLNPTWA